MRPSLHVAALVLVAMACGSPEGVPLPASEEVAVPVNESYAVTPARRLEEVILPTLSSPGWHLQAEPALEQLGRVGLTSSNGAVWMEAWSPELRTETFVVAVKWSVEPAVEFARLRDGAGRGELPAPPPNARATGRCETAQGLLLVYASAEGRPFDARVDALVGVSSKGNDPAQFPAVQRANDFVISWSSCTGFNTLRASMVLQRDPHLANAICEGRCCATAFPRTLITSAHLEVLASGGTVFTPRIDQSMQLPQTIEVNGVTVPLVDGVLSTTTLAPWRNGENQVSIRSGQLEPWTATVVLPSAPLNLRLLSSLDVLAPVRVAWEGGAWATGFLISIHPAESARTYVTEYVWMQKDVQGEVLVPWEGFRWNDKQVRSPVVTVRLVARHLASHGPLASNIIGGVFDLSVHAEQTVRLASKP